MAIKTKTISVTSCELNGSIISMKSSNTDIYINKLLIEINLLYYIIKMDLFLRFRLWIKNLNCRSKCCDIQEDHHDIIINVPSCVYTERDKLKGNEFNHSPININISQ